MFTQDHTVERRARPGTATRLKSVHVYSSITALVEAGSACGDHALKGHGLAKRKWRAGRCLKPLCGTCEGRGHVEFTLETTFMLADVDFANQDGSARRPRLESIPGISEAVLTALAKARVTLVQHLLAWPESELARQTGLSQQELCLCFQAVYATFVPRVRSGSNELAMALQANAREVSNAGCETVRSLTGAAGGDMVDIIGFPGSGKTQLCLTAAAAVASSGKSVILFDTSAALSVRRIVSILQARDATAGEIEEALNRIVYIPVATITEAETALHRLVEDIRVARTVAPASLTLKPSAPGAATVDMKVVLSSIGLVVFDSLASLLAPVLGRKWPDGWTGFSCSNLLASQFRKLATMTNSTILITNRRARQDGSRDQKGALGRSWAHVCDVKAFLEEVHGSVDYHSSASSEPKITLRYSSSRSPPHPVRLGTITANGFVLESG